MDYCKSLQNVKNDQPPIDIFGINKNGSIQDKKQKLGIKYMECLKNSYANNKFTDNKCYTYILEYNELINEK
jgi:hypothetical protein